MRVREFIARKREERDLADAQANYDPRRHREQVAAEIAKFLTLAGYRVTHTRTNHEGPLGGESDRVDVCIDTVVGDRHFMINIYAKGVYALAKELQ